MNILFKPLKMGDMLLPNRICMAALTRQRCDSNDLIPNDLMVKYYTLRADSGFMLTECVPISERSLAFPGQPGIYTKEQTQGWKNVVDSVHSKGGRIIAQIWHAGRACHSSFQNGLQVWAPSAIAPRSKVRRSQLFHEIPHQMNIDDIKLVIQQFKQAAINCKEAGFDGIQLHCGTGYLIDQFLRDSANKRIDEYGGTIQNRSKFCLEVIDEIIKIYGNGRVGVKISPVARVNDMCDQDPLSLFSYLIQEFDKRQLAFIELRDDNDIANYSNYGYPGSKEQIPDLFQAFRPLFKGVLIGNMGYTPETAIKNIEEKRFDAVTFGKLFISNPDLVTRIQKNYELNYKWDESTFYTKGEKGYLDYPLYEQIQQ
ncbi:unnamed protein product [Paramecium pentaurelia]|uniref:NADH:flavin oxidoreductase/NADH oxidase N-terminal domain-containing protein n=2 Tax=Paramecium pentaurelia TaxID=43138 RepID=A0A8S1SA67_9CILI|nr:unnamed protein product [Paramecium pentaurelia]